RRSALIEAIPLEKASQRTSRIEVHRRDDHRHRHPESHQPALSHGFSRTPPSTRRAMLSVTQTVKRRCAVERHLELATKIDAEMLGGAGAIPNTRRRGK